MESAKANPEDVRQAHAIMAEEMVRVYRDPEADSAKKATTLSRYLLICTISSCGAGKSEELFEQGLLEAGGEPVAVGETTRNVFSASAAEVRELERATFATFALLPGESLIYTDSGKSLNEHQFIAAILDSRRDPAA